MEKIRVCPVCGFVGYEEDAVEVVRCKDCKWHMNDHMGSWCGKLRGHPGMKADDFCSYG